MSDASINTAQAALDDLDVGEMIDRDIVEPESDGDDGRLTKPWNPALIRVDPKQFSIRQVLDMIDDEDLELQPGFQRRLLWKAEQKSLLIESILLRIPLPAFYFAADDHGRLQVIDGLQRLSSVYDFVRGGSDRNGGFRLSKLEYLQPQLGGLRFADIDGTVWSRRILGTQIFANVVDPQTPTKVKLNIFTRINKQGTPLSQQELRHAMSGNRSRQFLESLARSEELHEATGFVLRNNPRMHDVEIALRYCSFKLLVDIADYQTYGSLGDLLTETTERIDSEISDDQLSNLQSSFLRAMSNAKNIFGVNAFRKRAHTPINRALFEVWSYFLSEIPESQAIDRRDDILALESILVENDMFLKAITYNTGGVGSVLTRFSMVDNLLKEVGLRE